MEINSMFQAQYSRHLEIFSTYAAPMSWDQRLRDALAASGWSKAELARRSDVSYDNVNKYLAGEVKQPRGDTLEKLAGAFGLDPLFLAKGIDRSGGETQVP